jgi:hypothetical protein
MQLLSALGQYHRHGASTFTIRIRCTAPDYFDAHQLFAIALDIAGLGARQRTRLHGRH